MPYAASLEYALHAILHLGGLPSGSVLSREDLARFLGLAPSYVAKVLQQLKKAGLVHGSRGPHGGYRLARPLSAISFWDVIEAVQGRGAIFHCQEIRGRCVVFRDHPEWRLRGRCEIHTVMLDAESKMRTVLRRNSLALVQRRLQTKLPRTQRDAIDAWLAGAANEPVVPAATA